MSALKLNSFQRKLLNEFKSFVQDETRLVIDFRNHVFLTNQYGNTPEYNYSCAELIIDSLYAFLDKHFIEHSRRFNRSMDIESLRTEKLNLFLLDRLESEIDKDLFYAIKNDNLDELTHICGCSIADFCDEGSTVEVEAENVLNDTVTFYVQTVDGEYRSDLGCWLTTISSDGEVSQDEYPLFDFETIISAAEKHIKSLHTVKRVVSHIYTKTNVETGECEVLEENTNFINRHTSSYQTKWDKSFGTFDSEDEAIEFIELVFNQDGKFKNPKNCESLDELLELITELNRLKIKNEDCQDYYDSTDFPAFGKEPENTDELYSWDDDSVLLYGTTLEHRGWYTEPRCKVCGEATFHCAHDID